MYQNVLIFPIRKVFSCLLLLLFISFRLLAQNPVVKGQVIDSSEKKNLVNTSVSILRKADSVLVAYTRSDNSGNFSFKPLAPSQYIVMVSHPRYADYVETLDLSSNSKPDLGKIFLTLKSQLLQEVIVKNVGAIRIKGDTTEFKADSFMLRPGATVEDMLKKLPGMQVDKDGKIVFQGEAVQKVLLDGEEFFSDDPTIITKNMLSEAIDRVQVYDKKSDQAAFTGIDDGQKTKTIDLKLKDSRKQGYFGKVELGSDLSKYWDNKAMLNSFKGKRKFALFGIMSNTGKTGLNFDEVINYGSGGGMDMGMSDDGGMYINISGDNDYEDDYGEGLPTAWNIGGLYANKWNQEKVSANTSFQYKKLNTNAGQTVQSKYILPDTLYYNNEMGNSFKSRVKNSISGTYDFKLDSSSTLKITANAATGTTSLNSNNYSEALDEDGKFVNTSTRNTSSTEQNKSLNSSLVYRKKFRKPGRTISLSVNQNYSDKDSDGFLVSDYKYFDALGAIKKETTADQKKLRETSNSSVSGKLAYTQPISKLSILEFNYGLTTSNGISSVTSLAKSGIGGKYEDVIDSLTNNYGLNVLTNTAGINYRYAKPKKVNFSFGGNFSSADFTRIDRRTDTSISYNFINLFPRASVNYTLPNSGNLRFNYSGYTRAPSIDQIQPVKDNTDELNQRIGNPDLKQSFNQNFSINYDKYALITNQYISVGMRYGTAKNDFSSITFVDQLGKRITQPTNVNGNQIYTASMYYAKKLGEKPIRIGADLNADRNYNTNYVNNILNKNKTTGIGFGPNVNWDVPKKFEISGNLNFNYQKSTSSIRPDEPTEYWTQNHNVRVLIFLPWKLEFNTDCTFNIRQRTDAFDKNRNAIQWNAGLTKKILKDKGMIRVSMSDILNQNIGFDRTVNTNFISERTYNRIQRYGLLSFVYNFSKNGQPQSFNYFKYLFMKKGVFILILMGFFFGKVSGQFITKGLIEFERKTNQHALMEENSFWSEEFKKTVPQFISAYFDLRFDNGHTSYKPGREPEVKQNKMWGVFDTENQVAMNLDSNTLTASKSLEGSTFMISDSLGKIKWKIGSDTRTIAGFECRKAVGKIFDSVIVVAFYTDEIIPSGGPESFAGLPGMILGIAIPRLHTTWYATKLQLVDVTTKDLDIPRKGKKMATQDFEKQIRSIYSGDRSTNADMRLWQTIL